MTGKRVLMHAEYIRMVTAENIVIAYQSRQQSKNWAAWTNENPELAQILAEAEKLHAISHGY